MNHMFQVIKKSNGKNGYNVKIVTPSGDFIEIPAVTENNAIAMAFKIANAIEVHSTFPARSTWE